MRSAANNKEAPRRRAFLFVALGLLMPLLPLLMLLISTSCALVLGIDDLPLRDEQAQNEAGKDAQNEGDGGPQAFDPCGASTAFPPRGPDMPATPVINFVVRHPRFQGVPDDAGGTDVCPFGPYNLDNLDTCHGDGGGGASACVFKKEVTCDLGDGRDDALGAIIANIPANEGTRLDDHVENGELGLMIAISNYSGTKDDGKVTLDFFALGPMPGAPTTKPVWNGQDVWPIDIASCPEGNCSLISVNQGEGYVKDGVLFARAPKVLLPIDVGGSRVVLPVEDAIVTGVVSLNAGELRFVSRGRLAGRVPVDPALRAIGGADTTVGGTVGAYCKSNSWPFVLAIACERADLPSTQGATKSPCDSFSVGVTFEGWRAMRGKAMTPPAPADCTGVSFTCP